MTQLDLHIFRHGQTENNQIGRIQGHSDSPLTEIGMNQALNLGKYLKNTDIDYSTCYCSDLGRAVTTAEIVAKELNLEIQKEPRIREIHFGDVEGLRWLEIEEQYPQAAKSWHSHEKNACMPGGEQREIIKERIHQVLEDWLNLHDGEHILVCTHGGIISCLASIILKLAPGTRPMLNISNTAIHHIRFQNNNWSIQSWGQTTHLDIVLSTTHRQEDLRANSLINSMKESS